jgi:hypothetical protein
MKPTPIIACASLLAVAGHGTAAKAATVISDEAIKADLKTAICDQDWKAAIHHSGRLVASSTITPEHRQELVNWRYRFSQYAASGTVFAEIPNCGPQGGAAPKAMAPAPAATHRSSNPTAAPRIAAGPSAMCYVTYSDGRTVNLDHLCRRADADRQTATQAADPYSDAYTEGYPYDDYIYDEYLYEDYGY